MGFKDFMAKASDPFSQWGLTKSDAEQELQGMGRSGFETDFIQNFLPSSLRSDQIGGILQSGVQGIGQLIQNPGQLAPGVSSAMMPRLAAQSENISSQFRGMAANQQGSLARGNAPMSIKSALASALDVAQARAQRGARREALTDSDQLARQDLGQTMQLLNMIGSIIGGNRVGTATAAGQAGVGAEVGKGGNLMSGMSAIGSILSASRFKKDFESVETEKILDDVRSLPLYEWSYKGEDTRHVGPMAEHFLAAFGLGGDPDSISVVDAVGTLMAATQALASKVERLESIN